MAKRKRAARMESPVPKNVLDVLGQRIAELRDTVRPTMTQQKLGAVTGLGSAYINRIENGKLRNPGLSAIARIAQALGIDVVATLSGNPVPQGVERVQSTATVQRDPQLEAVLDRLRAEIPADDTWQGDVLRAIAVLNHALRRPSLPTGSASDARSAATTDR